MRKIVVIGGGSNMWGPIFMHEIFSHPDLNGSYLVLEDTNQDRLDLIFTLGKKMLSGRGLDIRLEKTTSLKQALQGADIVILTITTGGLEAMRADLEIPARYGIHQSVGDTVGPGGLSRSLRNIPVVTEIGNNVVEICPDALFLNYTNPMSTLTRALSKVGVNVVGLCHEWNGVRKKLASLFEVAPNQIQARVAGINHLIWVTKLWIDGGDIWPELTALTEKIIKGDVSIDENDVSVFADRFLLKARLFQVYNALPVAGDRHIAEFFSQYLREETNWGQLYGIRLTSIDDRLGLAVFANSMIDSVLKGDTALEPVLEQLPSEAVAEIIAAKTASKPYVGIMNLPNIGQISNLPDKVVVETMGTIDRTGAHAHAYGALPPGIQAVLETHVRNQEMTVEGALNGDRDLILQVLLNDPLSSYLTLDQAEKMLDELLFANQEYLPAFFD
jgi:alpha-galactosidase